MVKTIEVYFTDFKIYTLPATMAKPHVRAIGQGEFSCPEFSYKYISYLTIINFQDLPTSRTLVKNEKFTRNVAFPVVEELPSHACQDWMLSSARNDEIV